MTSETWLTTTTISQYWSASTFSPSATWFISAAHSVILNFALLCFDCSRSARKIAPIPDPSPPLSTDLRQTAGQKAGAFPFMTPGS
ncbi:hypothetical protein PtB15_2B577 [Puccinia triticina]|nr:hypothetical protein PtB15_2B577 [Puccinia triticina]